MSDYTPPSPNEYFPKNWNSHGLSILFYVVGGLFLLGSIVQLFGALKDRASLEFSITLAFMSLFPFFMGFVVKSLDDLVHLKRRQENREADDYRIIDDLEE